MFKHLIKIFILVVGLCCFNTAFATQCNASAKLTSGKAGAQVTDLNFRNTFSTRNDLWLEINVDQLLAVGLADSVTDPVGKGAFCSITFGAVGAIIRKGTEATGQDYIRITYGSPETSLISTSCRTTKFGSTYTNNVATPFNFHWPDHTGYPPQYSTGADYVAQVFWQVGGTENSNICRNTKLYIPLTSVQVNLGTAQPVVLDPNALYEIRNGLGTNQFVKNQTPLTFRPITGSCSVTAPPINLGTFAPSVQRTQGILGGVLKSTTVTLNCPKVYNGFDVTPKVTITDAYKADNTTCNPVNWATNGSDAVINLFTTATIGHTPAQRYCVYPVLTNGNQFSNTMTFPVINSPTYQKSMDIYAGLYKQQGTANPTSGLVSSTLTLTVTYN